MSQLIRFGTFQFYFRSDGSCRLAPPFPAHPPRLAQPLASAVNVGLSPAVSMDAVISSPSFLKAVGQGYIIPAPFDFRIDIDYDAGGDFRFLQMLPKDIDPQHYKYWAPFPDGHSVRQIGGSPWEHAPWVVKLRDYWYIETPPGYSCLFISPQLLTGEKLPFYALPGMVETDAYRNLITFPMIPQCEFPAVIQAGTPLVQVIPIKRQDWRSEVNYE